MKTIFKVILITIFSAFIGVMVFHFYKQVESWLNKPSQEQIKEQYKRVGY